MVKKCLFPSAGYGTRFLPATKSMPKEMLPIVNKPLIHYGVEEALEAGLTEITIVNGRNKEAIPNYFDTSYELEAYIKDSDAEKHLDGIRRITDACVFSYVRQKAMRGLGDAVLTGETLIGNQPFAVVLADDICLNEGKGVLQQLTELFLHRPSCIVAVQEVEPEQISQYGIIDGELIDSFDGNAVFQVNAMLEKPSIEDAPSRFAAIGRYILLPEIFPLLKTLSTTSSRELQLTSALNLLAKAGKVLAYRFHGKRFDCGRPEGFVAATNHFYQLYKNSAALV